MFGARTRVDKEELSSIKKTGELGMSLGKVAKCKGKVYGLILRLVNEIALGREATTGLVRGEH